jgi:hypothetical protein
VGTHPKHKCPPLATVPSYPLQRTERFAVAVVALHAIPRFKLWTLWRCFPQTTYLDLLAGLLKRESVDQTLRTSLIWNCDDRVRA